MFTHITRDRRGADKPEPAEQKCGCGGFDVRRYADGGQLAGRETWTVSKPYDADEVAADAAAERVMAGPSGQRANDLVGFGRAFGHDFAGVRLHTDSAAAGFARTMRAQAVTVGRQIFFREGAYQPHTPGGRRLLAHELAHVVQHDHAPSRRVRRQGLSCSTVDFPDFQVVLAGTVVHHLIKRDFGGRVPGAVSIGIPGASAGPIRTEGICGGFKEDIPPEEFGSSGPMAGMGVPDLARITSNKKLEVAEIKPAALVCLVDGEIQLAKYVGEGNSLDAGQKAWRTRKDIRGVVPMPPETYPPQGPIVAGPFIIRTQWCAPGLLAYHVLTPPRSRRVTEEERRREQERIRAEARRRKAMAAGVVVAGAAAARVIVGKAAWRHFWAVVIERFAVRAAAAAALALADGPLPFGELLDLGLAAVTAVQIAIEWNELWLKADQLAAQEGA
ncbi:DUF4157 domain-containing protein [Nonomuraea spiralis]|uniref:eCIS core domain-containing protein n=1 Tax=Nonomuraea TaxID=83681 RepID=UPI001C8CC303|nr:DUF4157 domain-containing protein [Nonomuraea sp. WAC 01424]